MIGGPPCQAFSIFGQRKGLNDPRGNLVWDYLRILQEIQPTAFVFENVAGLKSIHNGSLYNEILHSLELGGLYTVSAQSYQLANFGIPQFRDRIFFIGTKTGKLVPIMDSTHGNSDSANAPYRTASEALRQLPEPGKSSDIPNHSGRKHSQRIIDRYHGLEFGERDPNTRINKLHPERPSYTIIVGSDKGGGKGHVHPFSPREVTPRESARMQTFPDWWEFYGTGRHIIRQVSNAVPPLIAAQLAAHIREQFRQNSGHGSLLRNNILGQGWPNHSRPWSLGSSDSLLERRYFCNLKVVTLYISQRREVIQAWYFSRCLIFSIACFHFT